MGLESFLKNTQKNSKFTKTVLTAGLVASLFFSSCKDSPTDTRVPETDPPKKENRAPVINSDPLTEVDEISYYRYDIKANDLDGDVLNYRLVEGPAWLEVTHNSVFGRAPEVLEDDTLQVKVRVSDTKDYTDQEFDLTVRNDYNVHTLSKEELNNISYSFESPSKNSTTISSDQELTLTFPNKTDYSEKDVIIGGISDKTPYGILREIKSVSGDRRTMQTERASLGHAIKKGSFSFDQELSPAGFIMPKSTPKGISQIQTKNFEFSYHLENVVLHDFWGDGSQTISLSGDITFNMKPKIDVDFDENSIEAKIVTGANIDLDFSSELTLWNLAPAQKSFPIAHLHPIPVPGTPVVITPRIDIVVGTNPIKTTSLEVLVNQESTLSPGLLYDNGWKNISESKSNFSFSIDEVGSADQADLEAYAGPFVKLFFNDYGLISPAVQAGVTGNLKLEKESINDWKLLGGLAANAGVDPGRLLKLFIDPYNTSVIEDYELLKEGKGSNLEGEILFSSTRDGNAEIYVMNPDGSDQLNLTNNSNNDYEPSWNPNGEEFVFVSDRDGTSDIYKMNLNGSGLERLTHPINSNPSDARNNDREPRWSPDGSEIIFYSVRDNNESIWVMSPDGSNKRKIDIPFGVHINARWCGDQKIVFASTLAGEGGFDVYLVNRNGSNLERLTNNSEPDINPSCSPDGTKISYVTRLSDTEPYGIWTMNSDGSNKAILTSTEGKDDYAPSWSPNGKKVAYSIGNIDRSNSDVWIINYDGTGKTQLTFGDSFDPSWLQ